MAGCERNDDDSPSPGFYFGSSDDRGLGIVAALYYHIWLQGLDQLEGCVFGKYYDEIDALDGGKHESALSGAAHRPACALEATNGVIAVDADDQGIGSPTRRDEEVDVSRMEQIEDSVGESNPILSCSSPARRLGACGYFRRRVARRQSLLTTYGWKWRTCSFFIGSLMTSS